MIALQAIRQTRRERAPSIAGIIANTERFDEPFATRPIHQDAGSRGSSGSERVPA
jgi:hypothetical protein